MPRMTQRYYEQLERQSRGVKKNPMDHEGFRKNFDRLASGDISEPQKKRAKELSDQLKIHQAHYELTRQAVKDAASNLVPTQGIQSAYDTAVEEHQVAYDAVQLAVPAEQAAQGKVDIAQAEVKRLTKEVDNHPEELKSAQAVHDKILSDGGVKDLPDAKTKARVALRAYQHAVTNNPGDGAQDQAIAALLTERDKAQKIVDDLEAPAALSEEHRHNQRALVAARLKLAGVAGGLEAATGKVAAARTSLEAKTKELGRAQQNVDTAHALAPNQKDPSGNFQYHKKNNPRTPSPKKAFKAQCKKYEAALQKAKEDEQGARIALQEHVAGDMDSFEESVVDKAALYESRDFKDELDRADFLGKMQHHLWTARSLWQRILLLGFPVSLLFGIWAGASRAVALGAVGVGFASILTTFALVAIPMIIYDAWKSYKNGKPIRTHLLALAVLVGIPFIIQNFLGGSQLGIFGFIAQGAAGVIQGMVNTGLTFMHGMPALGQFWAIPQTLVSVALMPGGILIIPALFAAFFLISEGWKALKKLHNIPDGYGKWVVGGLLVGLVGIPVIVGAISTQGLTIAVTIGASTIGFPIVGIVALSVIAFLVLAAVITLAVERYNRPDMKAMDGVSSLEKVTKELDVIEAKYTALNIELIVAADEELGEQKQQGGSNKSSGAARESAINPLMQLGLKVRLSECERQYHKALETAQQVRDNMTAVADGKPTQAQQTAGKACKQALNEVAQAREAACKTFDGMLPQDDSRSVASLSSDSNANSEGRERSSSVSSSSTSSSSSSRALEGGVVEVDTRDVQRQKGGSTGSALSRLRANPNNRDSNQGGKFKKQRHPEEGERGRSKSGHGKKKEQSYVSVDSGDDNDNASPAGGRKVKSSVQGWQHSQPEERNSSFGFGNGSDGSNSD